MMGMAILMVVVVGVVFMWGMQKLQGVMKDLVHAMTFMRNFCHQHRQHQQQEEQEEAGPLTHRDLGCAFSFAMYRNYKYRRPLHGLTSREFPSLHAADECHDGLWWQDMRLSPDSLSAWMWQPAEGRIVRRRRSPEEQSFMRYWTWIGHRSSLTRLVLYGHIACGCDDSDKGHTRHQSSGRELGIGFRRE